MAQPPPDELLDMISDSPMTFEEIAKELGMNKQTVSQKLNALLEGGMNVQMTKIAAFAPTARPRKLVRR